MLTSTVAIPTVASLCDEARKLAPDERLELVEEILDTLDLADPEIDQLWTEEAKHCYEAYKRGEVQVRPFSEILAKYRDR